MLLPDGGLAEDLDALARAYLDPALVQRRACFGQCELQIVELELVGRRVDDLDATRVRADRVDRREGITKRHDAQKRGAPVGDLRQIVHEPAQGGLHLIEGADHHHERAKAHIAVEITRRRDHDRHHHREPAIAGRDPGEAREAAREAGHHGDHAVDRLVEKAALIRLAIMQHNAVGVLVDAHERDAQIGLPCIALGIERNERAADVPGEQRAA